MEVMYKWIIYAGSAATLILLGVLIFVFWKKKDVFKAGIKASNTSRIKSTKIYRNIRLYYNILRGVLLVGFIGCMISGLVLVSRPY